MGTFTPRDNRKYLYAAPNGSVRGYSWVGDHIDIQILRTIGVWRTKEIETAHLQSRLLEAIRPLGAGHWSELDHKTFWEWVDDYELHT